MNKSILICWFILLLWAESFSQILPGAKEIAMSNSTVAEDNNIFSILYNPSGIAIDSTRKFGIFFSPSPFGLKELRNSFATFTEPFGNFSISVGYKNYGFELYKENQVYIGSAVKLLPNFRLGISFSINSLSIKKYGQSNYFSCNLGNIIKIDESLNVAYSIRNIYLSQYDEAVKKPLALEGGVAFHKYDFILTASLLKETNYNFSYSLGADYRIIRYINIRAGFRNYPNSFSFGVGVNYSLVSFNYAGFNNMNLGLTHQIDIILQIPK